MIITVVRANLGRPPAPAGGILSEGGKRDSRGRYAGGNRSIKTTIHLSPPCSRQRRLHSGASNSDSAEKNLPTLRRRLSRSETPICRVTLVQGRLLASGLGWSRLPKAVVALVALFSRPRPVHRKGVVFGILVVKGRSRWGIYVQGDDD